LSEDFGNSTRREEAIRHGRSTMVKHNEFGNHWRRSWSRRER
jgi:hypothetical protein